MQLYNVLLNNKIPFVLLENDASENVIYCTEFTEHFFGVGEFATKTKPVILEYVTENDAKYVTTSITLEDGTCFNNVKFKVVQTKNILHSTINFNKLTDKEQVEFVEEEPQQIIQEEVVLPLPQPPSVQIDFKKEYQQQAYKALKEQQKTIPNLKQAYLNKLPLPLIVDNTTDNIIYCSNFKDYLFNVGIFQTKTKEVILEYTISADEKYVTGDVIFENGESYHQVKFRVVISEEIEVPYSTFNPVYAGRKYTDSIPLPPKPLPVPEIEEPLTEAEIFVQEQIVDKKREYEEAARLALLQQKKLQRETKELEQKKQQYENNKIVQETIDSYKQELLAEYLNTVNKQSELLDDRAKKSIEEAEHAVHKNILTIFDKYKNQLTHSVEELKNESLEQLTTTLSTHIDESKKGLEDLLTQWTANTDSKLTETLVSKVKLLEEQYQDKLLVELEKHKISLFHEFKTVSSQAINSVLEKKTADTTEIITNLFASKESQLQQTFELQIKDAYEELHGLVEHFKDKLPAISKNIQTLEERVEKLLEEKRQAAKVTEFNKEQKEYIATTAQYWARRILDLGGGGGSVATQYAKGGKMDGNLNVDNLYPNNNNGEIGTPNNRWDKIYVNSIDSLSANVVVELSGFFVDGDFTVNGVISATGGNSNQWNSTYNNVNSNSANYILDGGNTKGANIIVGTNDAFNLSLETNNVNRLTILPTGEIGIGTTTPVVALDVKGSTQFAGNISAYNTFTVFNQGSATGNLSFAIGTGRALGQRSFAQGNNTRADGANSYAEGSATRASGSSTHAEGTSTSALGTNAHAEGSGSSATGQQSHAEGTNTIASGIASHTEGQSTQASGNRSHAEGTSTVAGPGVNSHAEGDGTTASGNRSHTEGLTTIASGDSSHAEGQLTTASGTNSHTEGRSTTASGTQSHAEGLRTTAGPGSNTHAEGRDTYAIGDGSHAEGNNTRAVGTNAHVEGSDNIAFGNYSHAAGLSAAAAHDNTWVWHSGNTDFYQVSSTRTGQFLVSASGGVFFPGNVGIGTNSIENALTIMGNLSVNGTIYSNLTANVLASFRSVVGDGTNSIFTVNHGLNTSEIIVNVFDLTTKVQSFPTITKIDNNSLSLQFSFIPGVGSYEVIIQGSVPSNKIVAYGTGAIIKYNFVSARFLMNVPSPYYYAVDTSSGVVRGVLPATPALGDSFEFIDPYSTWGTNNFVIERNGNNIQSLNEDLSADLAGNVFKVMYVGSTTGWRVY